MVGDLIFLLPTPDPSPEARVKNRTLPRRARQRRHTGKNYSRALHATIATAMKTCSEYLGEYQLAKWSSFEELTLEKQGLVLTVRCNKIMLNTSCVIRC